MSSSGCCHLPGSLCDYSGNAESDASKDSEESDSTTQAQYIAKVTAKDGRPLSTVVKAVSLQRWEGEELAWDPNQPTALTLSFVSSPFSLFFFSSAALQWRGHVSDLSRRSWRRNPALAMRLHGHAGKSAQKLLGEVAVLLQHQLLWTLSHRIHHWTEATATHTGRPDLSYLNWLFKGRVLFRITKVGPT